jgi:predicted DsbA family dithiol-disulfide isomerase
MHRWSIGLLLFGVALFNGSVHAQTTRLMDDGTKPTERFTVEIWSDVVCPFCYIGKREFENALARFEHRDAVDVVWRSFELDPDAPVRSPEDTYTMLANKYGMGREEAKERVAGVVQRAATLGLDYHMDSVVKCNSFDAHRLIQLARTKGLGDKAEELLFRAHFMEGVAISDHAELVRIGTAIGLVATAVQAMLASTDLSDAVRADEAEAQRIGIRGVPFFAIDRRYAVSGAQQADHFLQALQQAWNERSGR